MQGDFRVEEWLVQPQLGTISKGDQSVSLEPKVMDVLVYFAHHPDEVLPKERIIQAVWPDTFVTDEVLTNAISELRKAFGDDARDPRYIQTLPRRGYRLIAPLSPVQDQQEAPPEAEWIVAAASEPKDTKRRWITVAAFAGVILAAGFLLFQWYTSAPPEGPIDSIAVLPFLIAAGDPDNEHLSEGIAGSISYNLSQLSNLRVVPTGELGRYREQEVTAKRVGDELNVRSVVTGTLAKEGGTLSVRVELVDAEENRLLWGERYREREHADVFELAQGISKEIIKALGLRLSEQEESRLSKRHTENRKAHENYLRGRFQAEGGRYEQAIKYLELAVEADPNYALAWVELANSHQTLGFLATSARHYGKARGFAQKALRIDPSLAEAHLKMAEILAFYDQEWLAAEEELRQARESNPILTSYRLPYLLLWLDRRDEAVAATEYYEERGDPLSAAHQASMAHRYYYLRDFDRALEAARKAQEMGLGYDIGYLVEWCYQAKGMEEEAFREWLSGREAKRLNEEEMERYRRAFEEKGMKGVMRLGLERPENRVKQRPYDLAGYYALAGQADLAFEWLERAYEMPVSMPFVAEARFDPLRDDSRYKRLLRKLNLPEEAIAGHVAQ